MSNLRKFVIIFYLFCFCLLFSQLYFLFRNEKRGDCVAIAKNVVPATALYQVLEFIVVCTVPVATVSRYEIPETIP